MSYKQFSERLNKELDNIGVPSLISERIEIFAKLVKVKKFQAQELLNGITLPNPQTLKSISYELDIDSSWLLGNAEKRQRRTN